MPEQTSVTVEIEDYRVVMEWPAELSDGGPQRLTIEPINPAEPPPGITSSILRKLSLKKAAETIRQHRQNTQPLDVETLREAYANGRRSMNDRYLALLSQAYLAALDSGEPRPNQYLADLLSIGKETIRGHLWQARKRNILSGRQGKAGGSMTEKGLSLLTE